MSQFLFPLLDTHPNGIPITSNTCKLDSMSWDPEFFVTSLMIRQTNILKQYKLEPNNGSFKKNIYEILSLLEKENNFMIQDLKKYFGA